MFQQIKLCEPLFARFEHKGNISPEELARLVPKLNVDAAARAQVFSHDGDFGAAGLWTSAGGQTCDCGGLQQREKQRLRPVERAKLKCWVMELKGRTKMDIYLRWRVAASVRLLSKKTSVC